MKNFIFKPDNAGLQKIFINKLENIQTEQRHQRSDLAIILRLINGLINDLHLQKQVDDYFEDDETSPQTDQDNKDDNSNN